ncbi:unnamed protein product [Closterium sp. NIES-53]
MFQLIMNGFFSDMLDKKIIVYLDGILVYSKTQEKHLKDLEEVFRHLQENRLIRKCSKYEFLKLELEFLGHMVSSEGVKIDPCKVDAIAKWKPPTNIPELQTGTNQIWVPAYQPLRELLTHEVHDSNLSGHFGIEKTLKLVQRNYYWCDMLTNVQRYVTTCPTYQAMKSS